MKKLILILVVLAICITMLFALTACKDPTDKINDLLNGNDEENDIDFMSSEEIQNNFTKGYVKIKVTSVSTTETEENQSDVYYIILAENDTAIYYEMTDVKVYIDKATSSTYLVDEDSKMFLGTDTDSAEASIGSIFSTYLASYAEYNDTDFFSKNGTATIAGRVCTKYSYSPTSLGGALSELLGSVLTDSTFEYSYYIDETTGLCLKFEASGSTEGEGGSFTWEVTNLTIGDVDLSEYADLPIENPYDEI